MPMTKQPDSTGNYETALAAAEHGIVCIPCLPGQKVPALKWKRYQTERPSNELLRRWFLGTRSNIAIICAGMVIFDCDDPAKADLVLAECGDTPSKLRTPSGGLHLRYRRRMGVVLGNQVRILKSRKNPEGVSIDIRTDGGLEVIPNSRTAEGAYEWLAGGLLPLAELPVAKVGWTRYRRQRSLHPTVEVSDADIMVRRARGYLACIEGAISGQRGHDRTYRVACKLTHLPPRGFGLSLRQAWPLIKEWNLTCEPEWSDAELLHKLEDAIKNRK